tara:strand:- start:122 stop:298 length:177 start_codon:yes stop_codon:yes gene_type:complete
MCAGQQEPERILQCARVGKKDIPAHYATHDGPARGVGKHPARLDWYLDIDTQILRDDM